jgi:hypothetical protein
MTHRSCYRSCYRSWLVSAFGLLAIGMLASAGCLQTLDPNASSGTTNAVDPDAGTGGPFPVLLETPPIAKTSDPKTGDLLTPAMTGCEKVMADSVAIRMRVCVNCHEGDGSVGSPLTHILEDNILMSASPSRTYSTWKYVVAGDPDNSLVYHRAVVVRDMPKPNGDVTMTNAVLTISDMSVLRAWIMCLAPNATGGVSLGTGGSSGATGAGGSSGATGTGGKTGAGGANGTGGRTGAGGATGTGGAIGGVGGAMAGIGGAPGGSDAGVASACTGIASCNNPTVVTTLPLNATITAAQAQAGVCYEVNRAVTAIGCTNAGGRRITVNGAAFTVTNGTCTGAVPAARMGGYCVQVGAFGGGGGQQSTTLMISG